MLTLYSETAHLIDQELQSVPEKYQKRFNSTHEALGVILEEFEELKDEIFFGEKRAKKEVEDDISPEYRKEESERRHKERIRKEAIQTAAMCVRLIQELT